MSKLLINIEYILFIILNVFKILHCHHTLPSIEPNMLLIIDPIYENLIILEICVSQSHTVNKTCDSTCLAFNIHTLLINVYLFFIVTLI